MADSRYFFPNATKEYLMGHTLRSRIFLGDQPLEFSLRLCSTISFVNAARLWNE